MHAAFEGGAEDADAALRRKVEEATALLREHAAERSSLEAAIGGLRIEAASKAAEVKDLIRELSRTASVNE